MFRSLTLWPRLWAAAANTLVAFLSLNFVLSNAAVKLGVKIFVFARFLCRVFGTRPELEPSSLSHYWIHPHWRRWKSPKLLAHLFFPNVALLDVFYLDLLFLLFAVLDSFKLVPYQLVPYNHGAHFLLEKPK